MSGPQKELSSYQCPWHMWLFLGAEKESHGKLKNLYPWGHPPQSGPQVEGVWMGYWCEDKETKP